MLPATVDLYFIRHCMLYSMFLNSWLIAILIKFPFVPRSSFHLRRLAFGALTLRHPVLFHLFLGPTRRRHPIYETKWKRGTAGIQTADLIHDLRIWRLRPLGHRRPTFRTSLRFLINCDNWSKCLYHHWKI